MQPQPTSSHNTTTWASPPRLVELAQQAARRYDLVFLCDTDIPFDDTWDRSGDVNREVMQRRIVSDLVLRRIPYFIVRGDLEERIATVKRVLARYQKYMNPVDHGQDQGVTDHASILRAWTTSHLLCSVIQ